MKKWIAIIVLLIAAIVGYNYVYQDHRDIELEAASYTVTTHQLKREFETASNETEQKYLNKTIEISGVISEINENDLTLNNHVFCSLSTSKYHDLKVGKSIKVKGRVIGYDNLLEQLKLDQCIIINHK